MKLTPSFLVVLVALAVSVAGHASEGQPALRARHVRAARGLTHTNRRRSCRAGSQANVLQTTDVPTPTVVSPSVSVGDPTPSTDAPPPPPSTSTDPPPPPPTSDAPPPPPPTSDTPPPPPPTSDAPPPPPPTSDAPPPPPPTSDSPPPPPPTPAPAPPPPAPSPAAVSGLVNVISAGSCGDSGATTDITAVSGPNGNIDFLNCGINSGGWTPPLIHIDGIISAELSQVAWNPGSAFTACQDFVPIFEKYGQQYGIPAIMLASFAMQESSCNPGAVGGNGEQGLMQLIPSKCGGAPNGNCQDPDFNIGTGAAFFSQTLNSVGGDVLLAIGQYNGWFQGMTYADATAAAYTGHCFAQNNLDYLHQFLNGWMQNIDAYTNNPPLGKYFNLLACQ